MEATGVDSDVEAVRAALSVAQAGLVDREAIAEAVVLSAVAGEHLLVDRAARAPRSRRRSGASPSVLGGAYFEYLIGRFTEPNELFGPIDLRRLREGVVEVETAGMLPEAEIAFLDEVFLGSTAILNTLLGMLNERVFRRGRTALPVPLRVCVGAQQRAARRPCAGRVRRPLPRPRVRRLRRRRAPRGAARGRLGGRPPAPVGAIAPLDARRPARGAPPAGAT